MTTTPMALEWQNANSLRKYPFVDDATLIDTQGIFSDHGLMVGVFVGIIKLISAMLFLPFVIAKVLASVLVFAVVGDAVVGVKFAFGEFRCGHNPYWHGMKDSARFFLPLWYSSELLYATAAKRPHGWL